MLIEPSAVAEIDSACIASGIAGFSLMLAAGHAVAARVLKAFPGAVRFVVLAGPGNNGGDGYVVARLLSESGATVAVFELGTEGPMTIDARRARSECPVEASPIDRYSPRPGDVVIDALFGAGLSRDLDDSLGALIEKIEAFKLPVLSIDMPSGIDGRTGAVRGHAFRADITVTFMALKPGQILLPGREYCGEIEISDIGVPGRIVAAHASPAKINHPGIWQPFAGGKAAGSHKYSHGALAVFSGGATHTGAARMAAEAGLRSGAGLVTLASPTDALEVNANHTTAVMLRAIDDLAKLESWIEDKRISAFVLGPAFGIGQKARDFVLALRHRNLVLDADGISSFRDDPETLFDAFSEGEPHLVLTPHDGEFARLFPDIAEEHHLSKVEKAQIAAKRSHAAVILKGADTVIASPDGRAAINTNAPPWLATAGSGDVLAGICGGLIAQGYPVYEGACAAVWHHGEAGNRAGRGLTAETLLDHIHG